MPADTSVGVSTSPTIFTEGTAWVWWETIPNDLGSWQNAEEFGFNITYVIRPNFNGNVFSTEEVSSFEFTPIFSKILFRVAVELGSIVDIVFSRF